MTVYGGNSKRLKADPVFNSASGNDSLDLRAERPRYQSKLLSSRRLEPQRVSIIVSSSLLHDSYCICLDLQQWMLRSRIHDLRCRLSSELNRFFYATLPNHLQL